MESEWNHTTGLGRPVREVSAEIVRELNVADIVRLGEPRGVRPTRIKKLTNMHHWIARMVAQGEAGYAIAMASGYTESRISTLKSDPAFQELVEEKKKEVDQVQSEFYAQVQAKMTAFGLDALEVLHEALLDGEMNLREVHENAKMVLDRTGHGPATKSQNLNLNIDYAGQIAEGRQRAAELTAAIPAARAGRLREPQAESSGPKLIEQADFTQLPERQLPERPLVEPMGTLKDPTDGKCNGS